MNVLLPRSAIFLDQALILALKWKFTPMPLVGCVRQALLTTPMSMIGKLAELQNTAESFWEIA